MSTFYSGAGAKLAAGLQTSYFSNSGTTINTLLNITSATFDPAVEKVSEETLLQSKVKNGSLLASITMDASFDANLRPEMTDWIFSASMQEVGTTAADIVGTTAPAGYSIKKYTLKAAGNDPMGSTLVLKRGANQTDTFTYPGMTVRSMTMTMPNNDFVTVSCDLAGREEIMYGNPSGIGVNAKPITSYEAKVMPDLSFEKESYIVTNGIFEWQPDPSSASTTVWCIETSTLTIDNGIEDSPRCYQDGKYANIPVMGMRSVTLDFNTPYDPKVETLKDKYLLDTAYGKATIEFTNAKDVNEKIYVLIPHLSITSVGAGISGTGVVDASISGEAIQQYVEGDTDASEPIVIFVQSKD